MPYQRKAPPKGRFFFVGIAGQMKQTGADDRYLFSFHASVSYLDQAP